MKTITNAIAELAGVIVDTVKNEPHEVLHVDEPSDPEFPAPEQQDKQNGAMGNLDALVDEPERGALHELDTFVDELEREVRDGATSAGGA